MAPKTNIIAIAGSLNMTNYRYLSAACDKIIREVLGCADWNPVFVVSDIRGAARLGSKYAALSGCKTISFKSCPRPSDPTSRDCLCSMLKYAAGDERNKSKRGILILFEKISGEEETEFIKQKAFSMGLRVFSFTAWDRAAPVSPASGSSAAESDANQKDARPHPDASVSLMLHAEGKRIPLPSADMVYLSAGLSFFDSSLFRTKKQKRPFSSIENMTDALIAAHNSAVPKDASVWICLGDFAKYTRLKNKAEHRSAADILKQMNGKIKILFRGALESDNFNSLSNIGFDYVAECGAAGYIDLDGARLMLSYAPGFSMGTPSICGAVFSETRLHPDYPLMCVGVDTAALFRPVSLRACAETLAKNIPKE